MPDPRTESCAAPVGLTESMRLVSAYQSGDDAALNELLARYQDRLRRIVRIKMGARLRRHLESVDLVQEANMVAARKLNRLELRNEASIIRWLSQIVLNRVRDAHKRLTANKRNVDRLESLDEVLPGNADDSKRFDVAGDEALPDDRAWLQELEDLVDDSMAELSEVDRDTILWRHYYGADWTQVAEALGKKNAHAAQQQYERAKAHLRLIIGPRLDEFP